MDKTGLAESAEPYRTPARIKVGPDGRILIPVELRREAGIEPGSTVLVEVRDGEVCVATVAARLRRVQEIAKKYKRTGESVVDEFLAERRAMWGEE
ncbi:MAG: AbrB/MazE/SpoVT family DNA-binding domain-containing protein [Paracoccaceae bacterium]